MSAALLGLPIAVPALALGGIYMVSKLGTKKRHKHRDRDRRHRRHRSAKSSSSSTSSRASRRTYKTARVVKRSLGTLKTAEERKESKLYVFFTYAGSKSKSWDYKHLPSGWKLSASGSTDKKSSKPLKYKREEVFKGPLKYREDMKVYLDKVFRKLLSSGNIERYKIRSTYELS